MPTIHFKPKGSILLKSYTVESASGHTEEGRDYKLDVKSDNTLVLEIIEDYLNIFKRPKSNEIVAVYEIGIDELISFIESNGKKT